MNRLGEIITIIFITSLKSTNLIIFSSHQFIVIPVKNKFALRRINPAISIQLMNFFKSICDSISICLTNIINRSLTTGVFPDNPKKASVTPIPKEGEGKVNGTWYIRGKVNGI